MKKKAVKVSKIVSQYRPDHDILYRIPGQDPVYVTTPDSFGVLYDRTFPFPRSELEEIGLSDLSNHLKVRIETLKKLSKAEERNDEEMSHISQQVQLFISLIEDMLKQGIKDYHSIIPTFSALQACIKSGWRPKNISKVTRND